jgi:predicted nucleic acid-binding protein
MSTVGDGELYLSVLVVGEIRRGVERLRRRDTRQAEVYSAWLAKLRRDYAERTLPVTVAVAEDWARVSVPDPPPVIDGLLAATARVNGLTFVTRNTADVERTGISLLNPFSEP